MTPIQVLSEIRWRGIELRAIGDNLLFRSKRTIPSELLTAMRTHRAVLLARQCRPTSPGGVGRRRAAFVAKESTEGAPHLSPESNLEALVSFLSWVRDEPDRIAIMSGDEQEGALTEFETACAEFDALDIRTKRLAFASVEIESTKDLSVFVESHSPCRNADAQTKTQTGTDVCVSEIIDRGE